MQHILCSMASMNQLLKTFVADGTLMEKSTTGMRREAEGDARGLVSMGSLDVMSWQVLG